MVSVIIPVYNSEKYLRQCLDSVLAQTFCDLEVIVVNDGSTDSSPAICDEYARRDVRMRVIHRSNGGLSAARNSGIDAATGEWYTFVDSDDSISPESIEKLMLAASQTGADIACSMPAYDMRAIGKGSQKITVLDADDAIRRTLHQTLETTNSVCGKIYRSEIFDGLRFTPGLWYEDLDIFYRLYARSRRIAFVNRRLYFYRQHNDSFTRKWTPRRLDVLIVMKRMEAWVSANKPALTHAVRDRHFAAACNMYLLVSRHDFRNPVRADLWQIIKQYRLKVLTGRGVRLKNRIGAALSFIGPSVFGRL